MLLSILGLAKRIRCILYGGHAWERHAEGCSIYNRCLDCGTEKR